jgi:twinkle protein
VVTIMSGIERTQGTQLVVVIGETAVAMCQNAGCKHIRDATYPEYLLDREGRVRSEVNFFGRFVILIPKGGENLRDTIAINLGDERCRWAYLPATADGIREAIAAACPMWTDEVATIDDIPEPRPENAYESGFEKLDQHGFRIMLPAFMPIIGPYGSGKSVFLRQLLVNLWKLHGWKFLLTSFEERVKPRYVRDFRRHLICNGPENDQETGEELWRVFSDKVQFSPEAVKRADDEIRKAAVFLRRKRNASLDLQRLLDRIEFAVRVHGVKVVAIDPVNEIDHQVPKGESKTDYMGRFIMALKALADDYDLLMICALHPPKDGVEKSLSKTGLLTLNDGADTAHWGNKADIGFCVWRNLDGPTYLHADKLKDHEAMGKPFLAELIFSEVTGKFRVGEIGYHILAKNEAE